MSELTPRQWKLYELLRNNPDRYLTQLEIAARLFGDTYEKATFHDTPARQAITADIRALNNSDVIQKIVISNSSGVKLASREEFKKYIQSEYAAIFRRLARTRKKARKGGLDGQIKLAFGSERETVEAFTEDISRLKAARLDKGLKLADVVRELSKTEKGIDISLLSKMEHGYCRPTLHVLLKLAQIYGVQPSTLSGGEFIPDEIIS